MESSYLSSLDYLARRRYLLKLQIDGEVFPDPYCIDEKEWVNDVTTSPDLQFGDIYTYLIDTKGTYTQETLKAYKSLEAYNYFYNGYVQTVLSYELNRYTCLKAKVNPSQKAPDHGYEAWVILSKRKISVITAHCKCMAG